MLGVAFHKSGFVETSQVEHVLSTASFRNESEAVDGPTDPHSFERFVPQGIVWMVHNATS